MKNKVLLDTNLWVYLYSQNSPNKSVKVRELVNNNFTSIIVSTQILGEFYNVWDSLVLATALQQNCNILYSEDMQANQLIEQKTIIINPFLITEL